MDWSDYIDFSSGGIFAGVLGAKSEVVRGAIFERIFQEGAGLERGLICSYAHRYPSMATGIYIEELREWTGYESVALFSTGAEATEAFWGGEGLYGETWDLGRVGEPGRGREY